MNLHPEIDRNTLWRRWEKVRTKNMKTGTAISGEISFVRPLGAGEYADIRHGGTVVGELECQWPGGSIHMNGVGAGNQFIHIGSPFAIGEYPLDHFAVHIVQVGGFQNQGPAARVHEDGGGDQAPMRADAHQNTRFIGRVDAERFAIEGDSGREFGWIEKKTLVDSGLS